MAKHEPSSASPPQARNRQRQRHRKRWVRGKLRPELARCDGFDERFRRGHHTEAEGRGCEASSPVPGEINPWNQRASRRLSVVSPQQRWGMDLQNRHADPCTETTRLHPSLPFPARQYPLPWSILSCPDALPGSSTAHEWLQWLQGPAAQAGPQMHETRTKETSLPLRDATGTITTFSEASFAVVPARAVCLSRHLSVLVKKQKPWPGLQGHGQRVLSLQQLDGAQGCNERSY